jgi:hypothetical protein
MMRAGNIFVLCLAASFFLFVVLMARRSRRDRLQAEEQQRGKETPMKKAS